MTEKTPKAGTAAAPPRDRRLPLRLVVFRTPQEIPGCVARVKMVERGKQILGNDAECPPLFLDPELRCVAIGDSLYPCDGSMIERVVRAKSA